METKELKIVPPEGYEIDKENSTFDCIRFKPVKRWRDNKRTVVKGFYIDNEANVCAHEGANNTHNYNLFTSEKQAKSALAMARISQIMANDTRFGGIISDAEWGNEQIDKYVLFREGNNISESCNIISYRFLAFHKETQRDLFFAENEDLVKDYLMLD